jgi:hypothetical protein
LAEPPFYEAITDKMGNKENKNLPFMHSDRYFKTLPAQESSAKTIYNFKHGKPNKFTDLLAPNNGKVAEYRTSTCTDLPFTHNKPSTDVPVYREAYQYKYARQ